MERFEQTIFSGLGKDQYNICWIEHTDKNRLELNYFISDVELTSGKNLTPYLDKKDRRLSNSCQNVINHEYGLSDPNAISKKVAYKQPDLNTPKNNKQLIDRHKPSSILRSNARHH